MAFHVGQRVVCVDGDFGEMNARLPQVGYVYTVQEVELIPEGQRVGWRGCIALCDVIFLVLEEFGDAHAWDGIQFRPVCESRLDQFRAHLAPTPEKRVSA